MAIENLFSWSKSRDEQFRECQRQYFYDKYLSWGGWDKKAPGENRQAYVLKNLKNRWAWKGETVHHLIEDVLKSLQKDHPVPLDKALERLTEVMRQNYRDSKAKKYIEDPKKRLGLFEHEYAKPVSDAVWKKIHEEASACLKGFYGCGLFRELEKDDKRSWLVIEDLEEFDLDGDRIFVKLDFARKKGQTIEIYDWKTGKNDEEGSKIQMGVYALYAMQRWRVGLENLRAFILNVAESSPVPQAKPITEELIRSTRQTVRSSAAEMRKLLADPVKNIPLPRENFKYTENTKLCGYCNFYKICEKYSPTT